MEDPEFIAGSRMLELLEQLKRERITLNLKVLGTGIEGLSILLGRKEVNGNQCLMMDFPAGARYDILYANGRKVVVEFSDKNKIHYSLKSVIKGVSPRNMHILLPKEIQRIQRRKFFRIPPPAGTKVIINDDDGKFEFNVIDISEGGALLSHPAAFHDDRKYFQNARKTLIIVYREKGDIQMIKVETAEIKRIKKILETGCYNYAFQFIDCGRKEENDIRNFVYSCQRRLLEERQIQEKDAL
jgi:c-di-GMP-binding flagellar brake protein YcgR